MKDSIVGGDSDVPTHDEREFTPHAQPGWLAWDSYSPELDFCRFVGLLQRMLQPAVVIETGAGAGRVTRHLDVTGCRFLGFESDPGFRLPPANPDADTFTPAEVAVADLLVLDSAPSHRSREIAMWAELGKPGSVCVVHDCGNDHPPGYDTHHRMRAAVLATGQPGVFLRNPRGAWMGVHQ